MFRHGSLEGPWAAASSPSVTASAFSCLSDMLLANHTINADDTYQPCGNGISSDNFNMCCAIQGRSSNGHDICEKNGLCGNAAIGNTSFWRESCTDRTWQSESCLKLCITGSAESSCSSVSVRGRKLNADGGYRSNWRADECQ